MTARSVDLAYDRDAAFDLATPSRPYLFETLPADLYARLDAGTDSATLCHRADHVLFRLEIRLGPRQGPRRALRWSLRRGFAGGEGTEYYTGARDFEPAEFLYHAPGRPPVRTASLRGALDGIYQALDRKLMLAGRLTPASPEFRPLLPSLFAPAARFDLDLLARAFEGGADLPAAAGDKAWPLRLAGRYADSSAELTLSDRSGAAQAAVFAVSFPFPDSRMMVQTRERALADAALLLVAALARDRQRGRPVTLFPDDSGLALAFRELALFSEASTLVTPMRDPDLERFDRAWKDRYGG